MSTIMARLLVLDTIKNPIILEEKSQHISEMTLQAENLTLLVKAEETSKVGVANCNSEIPGILSTSSGCCSWQISLLDIC